ncbi:MAG TPA: riboflavin synthase [Gemmatimonadaceae bacterium]|jgi:riboflavin synthase|nr:riboflavin synthase [Gemmatimonadaceae bacterium]
MFTGLIEQVGEVESVRQTDAGRELRIRAPFVDLEAGESIAMNGACLTVREFGAGWFEAAAVLTTLERTTIGSWKNGTRVNLERSLRAADRLGGHIVQGHVDCVGVVSSREQLGDALLIDLSLPASLEPLFVLHGSIAIDGVSLTVNDLKPGGVQVSLIDYTLRHTTLGDLKVGSRVHVEADVIAKHLRRLLEPYLRETSAVNSITDFSLEH